MRREASNWQAQEVLKTRSDSGSVAALPALGTLFAGIETMKKPAKQLRLCPALCGRCVGAWYCSRAWLRAEGAVKMPLTT
jgi:hypothetical protein